MGVCLDRALGLGPGLVRATSPLLDILTLPVLSRLANFGYRWSGWLDKGDDGGSNGGLELQIGPLVRKIWAAEGGHDIIIIVQETWAQAMKMSNLSAVHRMSSMSELYYSHSIILTFLPHINIGK